MEFFILFVFSIGLCQAGSVQTEVDCDDPEVFSAVGKAIQALNEDRRHGNKFALNVILQAYRREGPEKKFHVIYQVRETTCPIEKKEPWENCDLFAISEADSGECIADVDISDTELFSSISQKCKMTTGVGKVLKSKAECLGCWHSIDPENLEVLPIVRYSISQFNNKSEHLALFEVEQILKAHRKVVNGWDYHVEYLIKETNCSKDEFPDLNPACRPLPGGREGSCKANAHIDSGNLLIFSNETCTLQVGEKVVPPIHVCPGCPAPIETDSPELERPLAAALESFNSKNNHDFYFKTKEVIKATTQVVAGIMYRFDFTIQKTNCSKAEFQELNEDCSAADDGELLFCHGSVYVKPWQSLVIPQVTCTEGPPLMTAFRRPPGFTPFRSSVQRKRSVGDGFHHDRTGYYAYRSRRSRGGGRAHGHGKGHGHGHGRGHGRGHGHYKPIESYSEEDDYYSTQRPGLHFFPKDEIATVRPSVFSELSATQGSITDPFSDRLPDLPAPPRCPGKPWNPIRAHSTPSPKPKDPDFDLEDALG